MKEVRFVPAAWEEYQAWQYDRKTQNKINELIKSIQREGVSKGIGKPEPLKYKGAWSRRIDQKNRLVYSVDENNDIIIYSCKEHYED